MFVSIALCLTAATTLLQFSFYTMRVRPTCFSRTLHRWLSNVILLLLLKKKKKTLETQHFVELFNKDHLWMGQNHKLSTSSSLPFLPETLKITELKKETWQSLRRYYSYSEKWETFLWLSNIRHTHIVENYVVSQMFLGKFQWHKKCFYKMWNGKNRIKNYICNKVPIKWKQINDYKSTGNTNGNILNLSH